MSLFVDTPNGQKEVKISMFSALEGLDLKARFIEFAASRDRDVRRRYTLDVLKFAKVVAANQELPLTTNALIDNHLCSWQNVQLVFEAVLLQNGINPAYAATEPDFWIDSGAELAASFVKSIVIIAENLLAVKNASS